MPSFNFEQPLFSCPCRREVLAKSASYQPGLRPRGLQKSLRRWRGSRKRALRRVSGRPAYRRHRTSSTGNRGIFIVFATRTCQCRSIRHLRSCQTRPPLAERSRTNWFVIVQTIETSDRSVGHVDDWVEVVDVNDVPREDTDARCACPDPSYGWHRSSVPSASSAPRSSMNRVVLTGSLSEKPMLPARSLTSAWKSTALLKADESQNCRSSRNSSKSISISLVEFPIRRAVRRSHPL